MSITTLTSDNIASAVIVISVVGAIAGYYYTKGKSPIQRGAVNVFPRSERAGEYLRDFTRFVSGDQYSCVYSRSHVSAPLSEIKSVSQIERLFLNDLPGNVYYGLSSSLIMDVLLGIPVVPPVLHQPTIVVEKARVVVTGFIGLPVFGKTPKDKYSETVLIIEWKFGSVATYEIRPANGAKRSVVLME